MPDIPLPPVPTPTNTTLSGGTWASGPGNTQTSGTPIDYAEYRQWMTLDYTRNPHETNPISNTVARTLAELSATNYKTVTGTRLHYNVTVHNSCTFLSGTYDLSASYQPQKFVLMAQKFDKAGYSYGEVDGSANEYVFGPQGSLITTQPYIRRKPLESADIEYSLTQVGTTDGYATSGNPWTWGTGDQIGQPYSIYLDAHYDIIGGSDFPRSIWETALADPFAILGGGYNTSSEPGFGNNSAGVQRMISFIEKVGAALAATVYNWRFCVPTPTNSDGFGGIVSADRLAINPYYSTAFHDYT